MDAEFEWDEAKAARNIEKHGISFEEAARVFLDPNLTEVEERAMPYDEVRFAAVGKLADDVIMVVYTYREERIRIISARKAHRNERKKYNQI